MIIRNFINWNTLRADSWIGWRFNITPSISIRYDKNEICEEEYIKSLWVSFDWLCITCNLTFEWDKHKILL